MTKAAPKYLVAGGKGATFVVECALDHTGSYPADDFLKELGKTANQKTQSDIAGLLALASVFCNEGKLSNETQFKKIEGTKPALFEFKKFQLRLIGFYNGPGVFVVTNCFIKQSQKTDRAEISRAHKIRAEHLSPRKEK